jgi:pimeloyl-ACP methyl ester carboxylesterase
MDRRAVMALGLAVAGCATARIPAGKLGRMPPPLWGPLTLGPYDPGLAVAWRDDAERRIQVWDWRPAIAGSGSAMRVGDLGALYVAGGPSGWPTDPLAFTATGYDEPGQDNGATRLAALPVASRAGAAPAQGRFPAVVLGQGFAFESPFHQHVMAEYLASWGYRVLTAPLTGPGLAKADVSSATLTAQVDDLALLARRSGDRRPALVGYDLGGMAVVALAGSGRVLPDVVIGIDSGVIGAELMRNLVESRPDFDWARLGMPYVHFTRSAAENMARNLPESLTIFERAAGAARALIRVPQMRHADFGAVGAIENALPGLYGEPPGNPAWGHAATIDLVRQALDHWTRGGSAWRPVVTGPITIETW